MELIKSAFLCDYYNRTQKGFYNLCGITPPFLEMNPRGMDTIFKKQVFLVLNRDLAEINHKIKLAFCSNISNPSFETYHLKWDIQWSGIFVPMHTIDIKCVSPTKLYLIVKEYDDEPQKILTSVSLYRHD
jgi:hypothetical protein